MKSSKDIVGSLIKKHSFSSLLKYLCYREFLRVLPPRFQKVIAFVTIKNSQLLIAIKHPGYKMELNYNKEVIKSLLSSFVSHRSECDFMGEVKSIAIFHSKFHPLPKESKFSSVPYLPERAKGDFDVKVKDSEIKEILLEIREIIKEH